MYPFQAVDVGEVSSEAGLVPLLTTSRVLKAYPVDRADLVSCPRWVLASLGLLIVLVTAAVGPYAWLYSLGPASSDEVALATFLALLVTASWLSATWIVAAIALLAVLWGIRFSFSSRGPSCMS